MTFRVGGSRLLGAPANLRGSGPERDPRSTEIADQLSAQSVRELDATSFTRDDRTYGTPLALSTARRIADSVRQALESVREYRELQVGNAQESQSLALSSRGNELDSLRITYETEITRIRNTTSFNGTNLFTSGTIDLGFNDVSQGLVGSFVLGSPAAAAAQRTERMNTPTAATNNIATYEKALASLSAFTAGTGALVNRIDAIASAQGDSANSLDSSLTDAAPTDPKLFAAAAAQVLAEPYAQVKSTQLILEGTPDTAPSLPDEDDELRKERGDRT